MRTRRNCFAVGKISPAMLAITLLLGLLGCATSPAAAPPPVDSGPGLQAFQTHVYPVLRARCASCHAAEAPQIAAADVNKAYQASREHVDFAAVQNSSLFARAQDGHCGPSCRGGAGDLLARLKQWADQEASGPRGGKGKGEPSR